MVLPWMIEWVPEELLAIMPPMVARLAVEMSGANCKPSGLTCWLRSSSTQPGSTRTHFSAALISRMRLQILGEIEDDARPDRLPRLRGAAAARRDRHAEAGTDFQRRPAHRPPSSARRRRAGTI